jgi:adenosylmethionine-8-amino-7-oxononanoate aminotransferase
MAAILLEGPKADEWSSRIQLELMQKGIISYYSPPYVITKEQLDMTLETMDSTLDSVRQS